MFSAPIPKPLNVYYFLNVRDQVWLIEILLKFNPTFKISIIELFYYNGNRSLGRPRRRWEDIRMGLRKMG
jgi:hypothetical protein